jgi:hypothetical protein
MIGPMIPGHLILSPTGILTSRYREAKRNQKMTTTNERETLAHADTIFLRRTQAPQHYGGKSKRKRHDKSIQTDLKGDADRS